MSIDNPIKTRHILLNNGLDQRMVQLMSQKNYELKEQRHHARTALGLPAELTLNAKTHAVWVQDISLKGVLITGSAPTLVRIEPQSTGHLVIRSDPEQITVLELDIRIARINAGLIGATWGTIDLENLTSLRELLNANFADSALLERELFELVH